jgi:hypothetical protein
VSNITEIRPIGASLTHADRRTDRRMDMTKLIGAFCDYAKELKYFNYQTKNYLYETKSNLPDKTYDFHVFAMLIVVNTKTIFSMCHVVMLSLLVVRV